MQAMQSTPNAQEKEPCPLQPKELRRVYSNDPTEIDKIIGGLDPTMQANETEVVLCECCGMSEDCTPTYISRTKAFFCGKWVCGLCSEAVKERTRRDPSIAMEEALESHTALCKNFDRTIRRNPKLSLADAMREIARKSSQKRASKDLPGSKINRTMSCGPRLNVKIGQPSIQ